jgi:hypothetical protein
MTQAPVRVRRLADRATEEAGCGRARSVWAGKTGDRHGANASPPSTLAHANTEPVRVGTSPPECVCPAFAAGLACFYNEKVDLYLGGELQDRARTTFS